MPYKDPILYSFKTILSEIIWQFKMAKLYQYCDIMDICEIKWKSKGNIVIMLN